MYQGNKKGWGWDEEVDTFKYYATDHRKRFLNSPLISGWSLCYLKVYPLSYLKICTHLTFRFGKLKFRFPSSLRNGYILWDINIHTNHLGIKKEREGWSIFISVSLWIFLFIVCFGYSPQTKEKRRTGRQPAKWPAQLPMLCFLGGNGGKGTVSAKMEKAQTILKGNKIKNKN